MSVCLPHSLESAIFTAHECAGSSGGLLVGLSANSAEVRSVGALVAVFEPFRDGLGAAGACARVLRVGVLGCFGDEFVLMGSIR